MARGAGTQQFPAGAQPRLGACTAPLHDGPTPCQVVAARIGFADTGPVDGGPELQLCADCLADFSVVSIGMPGGELCPFVKKASDGMWHQVKGTLPL